MPSAGAEECQRVVDVVAVADEGDDEAIQPPESLANREHVGERLAWMLAQRQAVDDRDAGLAGQLSRDFVRAGPDDDAVDEPLEVPSHVPHALAGAEHDVMGQIDRMPAELDHAGLEGHPRPQARLLEQHRQRPTDQRRRRVAPPRPVLGLERGRRVEDPPDLIRREVSHTQQIPPDQRTCGRRHQGVASGAVKRSADQGRSGEGAARGRERAHPKVRERPSEAGNARMDVPGRRR